MSKVAFPYDFYKLKIQRAYQIVHFFIYIRRNRINESKLLENNIFSHEKRFWSNQRVHIKFIENFT